MLQHDIQYNVILLYSLSMGSEYSKIQRINYVGYE